MAAHAARRARAEPAPARPRSGARRRRARADRGVSRVPAIAVALFLVIEGGLVFALGLFVLGVRVHARALRDVRARASGRAWPASSRSRACWRRRYYGDQFQILLVAVAALPVLFALTLAAAPAERRGDGADAARDLLDRLRPRPRGAAARPAARAGHRDRRARRHVPRRHRRLPRRAHVRAPAAGPAHLAEQDRRGPA